LKRSQTAFRKASTKVVAAVEAKKIYLRDYRVREREEEKGVRQHKIATSEQPLVPWWLKRTFPLQVKEKWAPAQDLSAKGVSCLRGGAQRWRDTGTPDYGHKSVASLLYPLGNFSRLITIKVLLYSNTVAILAK